MSDNSSLCSSTFSVSLSNIVSNMTSSSSIYSSSSSCSSSSKCSSSSSSKCSSSSSSISCGCSSSSSNSCSACSSSSSSCSVSSSSSECKKCKSINCGCVRVSKRYSHMKNKIAFLKQVNSVMQFIIDTLNDALPNVCNYACKPLPEANGCLVKLIDNVLCVVEKNSYKCLNVEVCKQIHENGNVDYELKFTGDTDYSSKFWVSLQTGRNKLPGTIGLQRVITIFVAQLLRFVKNNKAEMATVFSDCC